MARGSQFAVRGPQFAGRQGWPVFKIPRMPARARPRAAALELRIAELRTASCGLRAADREPRTASGDFYCIPIGMVILVSHMTDARVWQGTLALMVLKTLDTMGPQHGYGLARRIEQTSDDLLSVNYGTLYPALLKLEQEGYISSEWGVSDNNRRAKFYSLTRAGRRQLAKAAREWQRTTGIIARFFSPEEA